MSQTFDFLRECGVFFVLTVNGNSPAGRPFGAVMEYEGILYFSTAKTKAVYQQLIENPAMQLIALKPGTRQWVRVSGTAVACETVSLKQRMLDACPALKKRFPAADGEDFALFALVNSTSCLHTDNGTERIS